MKKNRIEKENALMSQLSELLNVPDPKNVITSAVLKNGKTIVFLESKKADPALVSSLQADVSYLKKTLLWKILNDTLLTQARTLMFENSESFDDMRGGKYMLYTLKVQRNILDTIENFVEEKKA